VAYLSGTSFLHPTIEIVVEDQAVSLKFNAAGACLGLVEPVTSDTTNGLLCQVTNYTGGFPGSELWWFNRPAAPDSHTSSSFELGLRSRIVLSDTGTCSMRRDSNAIH